MHRIRTTIAAVTVALLSLSAGTAPASAAPPAAGETQLISVSTSGAIGDGSSWDPAISADGRFVAFQSTSSNLDGVTGGTDQIYVRELSTGVTTLISKGSSGIGDASSMHPSISDDGGVVAYISRATNIVSSARTGIPQALVWNRTTGLTTLASFSDSLDPANREVTQNALSGDGTHLAFTTAADNLVAADGHGVSQVYVRDLDRRTTTVASVSNASGLPSATAAADPAIAGDGNIVAFTSTDALGPLPANDYTQVYLRDVNVGATVLVTLNVSGTAMAKFSSQSPSVSRDGKTVAFASDAFDLIDHPSGQGIYWRNWSAGVTRLASPSVFDDRRDARGSFRAPKISADASSITFVSSSPDLTREGRGYGRAEQVYQRDLGSHTTVLVSRPTTGADAGGFDSLPPSVSGDGGLVAFGSYARNLAPTNAANIQAYLRDTTETARVDRIGGADRFAVSANVSADTFGANVPVAYVASGAAFPDALSGSAAAGLQHAPVLLVAKDSIPSSVAAELRRLTPQKIIVLGGTNTIDDSVQVALGEFAPTVKRIAGADRFDVSVGVSSTTFGQSGSPTAVAYVASGAVFPDALSGSAAAGYASGPVLLVTKDSIPTAVAIELGRLRPGKIVVLGGTNTISDDVAETLKKIAPVSRIDGADRFAVSAAVSATTFPAGMRTAFVASGAVFPDALSGSAAAIRRVGPVLLVTADRIPEAVKAELARLKPTRIIVLGGTNTVSDAVLNDLRQYAVTSS